MFIGYEQIAVGAVVQTIANLAPPANTTHVVIQAETQDVRYTMDGTAPTGVVGMLFIAGAQQPTEFLSEDLLRIQFFNGPGGPGVLNLHYSTGRAI